MKYNIAVIKGDGIGPEIINEAIKVLDTIGKKFGHTFNFIEALMGGCAIDRVNNPLPQETIETCKAADSVLLGAVGGPKWDKLPGHLRPENGLLGLRSALNLYANLRPATLHKALINACPLKTEIIGQGFDIMFVRELTGGMYFGERGRTSIDGIEAAYDTELYSVAEVERIGLAGFKLAMQRGQKLCSVDKANVLESSRLWREVMHRLKLQFPMVEYSDMLVDNAAMQLVRDPKQFDVIVTSNMFGDILSDEASMITGSIGMLPSASLGAGSFGMYEPIHGSAPDIAGQNKANPIATILSVSMMLKTSFNLTHESDAIDSAVAKVFENRLRTSDIMSDDCMLVGTTEMGNAIVKEI